MSCRIGPDENFSSAVDLLCSLEFVIQSGNYIEFSYFARLLILKEIINA